MALTVEALDHLAINVADVERSAVWYQRALGMTREDFNPKQGNSPRTALKVGRQQINLRPVCASKAEWFTAEHETAASHDLCFLTARNPSRSSIIYVRVVLRSRLDRWRSAELKGL